MKTNYFQLYEEHRCRYFPGAIWITKSFNSVKRLKVVNPPKDITIRDICFKEFPGKIVYFEILETSGWGGLGNIIGWPESYMEKNYKIES